MSLLRIFNTRF